MSEQEIMESAEEIRKSVDASKDRKSFNIIDVLNERAYPEAIVRVHLDEATAYQASLLKEKFSEIESAVGTKKPTETQARQMEELSSEIDELVAKMNESTYTFTIMGISEGTRERLYKEAKKKYPIEYQRSNDLMSLVNQNPQPVEKESPERDELFTDMLWKEHIKSIEAPDGSIQKEFSFSDTKYLRQNLPLSAIASINSAIEKIRTATAVFMMETGEDFLAKP